MWKWFTTLVAVVLCASPSLSDEIIVRVKEDAAPRKGFFERLRERRTPPPQVVLVPVDAKAMAALSAAAVVGGGASRAADAPPAAGKAPLKVLIERK